MRLLNTTSFTFEEIDNVGEYSYAILSHCWGREEVSYEDFLLSQQPSDLVPPWQAARAHQTTRKAGYCKILQFCQVAKLRGFDWCWIDTCCIDKKSSAELSESINSMWNWYWNSGLCIVYLADVDTSVPEAIDKSRWFRRCWTLQELLAPRRLLFCASSWDGFGAITKDVVGFLSNNSRMFLARLSANTRIPVGVLQRRSGLESTSVAQRMSWAAGRRATRDEDVAYSLLGIFDINMPLLYGEGLKAFMRLQEEIIRRSPDDSIFAWTTRGCEDNLVDENTLADRYAQCWDDCCWPSLLADSPDFFRSAGNVIHCTLAGVRRQPYSITNQGLQLTTDCERIMYTGGDSVTTIYLIALACSESPCDRSAQRCYVAVREHDTQNNHDLSNPSEYAVVFERLHCCKFGQKLQEYYPSNEREWLRQVRLYLPLTPSFFGSRMR